MGLFYEPEHIVHWNFASEDWCTPWARNDLRVGGKFVTRMEAKDGSFGFDFEAESENNDERQKYGWQCILDNFKKYSERKNY